MSVSRIICGHLILLWIRWKAWDVLTRGNKHLIFTYANLVFHWPYLLWPTTCILAKKAQMQSFWPHHYTSYSWASESMPASFPLKKRVIWSPLFFAFGACLLHLNCGLYDTLWGSLLCQTLSISSILSRMLMVLWSTIVAVPLHVCCPVPEFWLLGLCCFDFKTLCLVHETLFCDV